jgi:hypothetical protein
MNQRFYFRFIGFQYELRNGWESDPGWCDLLNQYTYILLTQLLLTSYEKRTNFWEVTPCMWEAQHCLLATFSASALRKEVVCSSKTSASFYPTTWRCTPQSHRYENLTPNISTSLLATRFDLEGLPQSTVHLSQRNCWHCLCCKHRQIT